MRAQRVGGAGNGVVLPALRHFPGIPVGGLVHGRVARQAPGLRPEKLRTAAVEDPFAQFRRHLRHPVHIVAVCGMGGNAERLGARRRAGPAGHRLGACRGGEGVVLADEQHRQVEDPRPVQPLQEGSAIDGAVAEDTADDAPLAPEAHRMGRARGDVDVGADDPVRPQHPDREVGNVHGAALAAAIAALAPEELAHHGSSRRALLQRVAVAAMGGQQQVLARKAADRAHRAGFLPDGGVDRAQHQPFLKRGDGLLLEGADAMHPPMPVRQPLKVEIGPVQRPRTRFEMMLRWISLEPAKIVCLRSLKYFAASALA